jgi:hypothetical protein
LNSVSLTPETVLCLLHRVMRRCPLVLNVAVTTPDHSAQEQN